MGAMRVAGASPLKQAFSGWSTPACRRGFATTVRREASYGFIGLGRMGYPMAKNLRSKIKESDTMVIHDVNESALKKFKDEMGNVEIAKNVREVAEKTGFIITVLPEPSHVKSVYKAMLEPATLRKDASVTDERIFVDCSTIDPKTSAEAAELAESTGQGKFIDAPMSGGVVGATAGSLTFMIGCPEDGVDRVKEVLSLMGKRVVHLGPQTSGLKGKLANNYLLAINNIATCEAMNMGIKWGLDGPTLAGMINSATGKCWPSESNNPVPGVVEGAPSGKDYAGGFGTALMMKDLGLAMTACAQHGITPKLGPFAQEIYSACEGSDSTKGRDFSVVYRYLGGKE